jgi:hypothetical protein
MASIIRTMRGKKLNMTNLVTRNESAIAVTGGGIAMNARGDFIDKHGKVIKTRESIDAEYLAAQAERENQVRQVSLHDRTFGRAEGAAQATMMRKRAEMLPMGAQQMVGPTPMEQAPATPPNPVQRKANTKRVLVDDDSNL